VEISRAADAVAALQPHPPRWVHELLSGESQHRRTAGRLQITTAGPYASLTISIPHARALAANVLRQKVAAAYLSLAESLATLGRHPLRFWSFVPGIGDSMGHGIDRYMVFNAGRHDAYARWPSTPGPIGRRLATASAIGITGPDLLIHCLAATKDGTGVENPRQTSSWKYSRRYGPKPPCFSRATLATLSGRSLLLIGGTASIVGERSRHPGEPAAQVEETLKNLAAVIGQARDTTEPAETRLASLVDLRIYVVRAADAETIRALVRPLCPRAGRVEMNLARLCRPELLVEIEGVAEI
jgi:chorismate lyase / 3-hydroxybenzoate synthase